MLLIKCFRFSIRRSVLEIFVIKVESCQKSHQIVDVFRPPKFCCDTLQNLYPRYHPCLAARRLLKFSGVIANSHKVIGTPVLNFKPNCSCLPLKFFGEPRPSLECALANQGQCLARVKIRRASTPFRPKFNIPKKCTWVGQHGFFVSGPTFTIFPSNRGRNVVDQLLF